jgi:hypothetical protein
LPIGLRKQLEALDIDDRMMLSSGLAACCEALPEFSFGTACSGTEVLGYVLEVCTEHFRKHFQVNLQVRHRFCCELVEWKRTWIQGHFQPDFVFEDIRDLLKDSAVNLSTGNRINIPKDLSLFAAGFECDSLSSLNANAASFRGDCLQRAVGKTGESGCACLAFIAEHRPLSFFLESVKQLL